MKFPLFVRILIILVFIGAIFVVFTLNTTGGELAWSGDQFPLLNFAVTAGIMLLGIIFGCLFRQIHNSKESIQILAEIRKVFASSSFWAAICISPFIFGSVYASTRGGLGDSASYLLAFQNGFFCESIFRQLFAKQSLD